ncbi:tumor necrosis factor receptor superfamily member 14-like [Symphorus nematophorus]
MSGNRVKTDCTELRSTYCLPCTEGTYMNRANGLRQCFPCNNCNEGSGLKMKMSCTTTADAVCELLEGFFCIDYTDDGCAEAQKHRRCKPGQYISQTGTSSRDTECSDCRDGTFSDGRLTSCQPHTQCESLNLQLIKAGTVSTDAECGERSSDKTGTVIGIVVAVVFLGIAASESEPLRHIIPLLLEVSEVRGRSVTLGTGLINTLQVRLHGFEGFLQLPLPANEVRTIIQKKFGWCPTPSYEASQCH